MNAATNLTELRSVKMTRAEAEKIFSALLQAREGTVLVIKAIDRKKYRASEKAMMKAPYYERLEGLELASKMIGEAFNLGGY